MKHILLATTALVATAGVASAEVGLSGSAEIGVIGGESYETAQFHTDVDVTFSLSGEADNGLTFGGTVDLDESISGKPFTNTTQGGETLFIAYGPSKLTMGDTDGAFDAAMQEISAGGSINDDSEHLGYNGNSGLDGAYDGQIATFSYGANGFNGFLSVEIDDGDSERGNFDPIWGIGGNYSAESGGVTWQIGLGYQSGDKDAAEAAIEGADLTDLGNILAGAVDNADVSDTLNDIISEFGAAAREDVWGISVGLAFDNGFNGGLNYSETEYASDDVFTDETGHTQSHWGIGLGYGMNAMSFAVNYGEYTNYLGIEDMTLSGWGIAAGYDLGGGLEAQLGYGDSEISFDGESSDSSSWSLGVAMSF